MIPASFDYTRPTSVGAAVEALAADEEAKVIAGGQSLLPLLRLRFAYPTLLVDLGGIPSCVASATPGTRWNRRADHALRADQGPAHRGVRWPARAGGSTIADPAVRHRARSAARCRTPTRPGTCPP